MEGLLPSQRRYVEALLSRKYSLIAWVGAVRQGKTVAIPVGAIALAVLDAMEGVGNRNYILAGQTIEAINRNQKLYWMETARQLRLPFRHRANPTNTYTIDGLGTWNLFGGDQDASEDRIKGLTATHAFCDEATTLSKRFVNQVEYRLSYDQSCLSLLTNAGNPYSFVKTDYIDAERDRALLIESQMGENIYIGEERTKRYLSDKHAGAGYARNVLNQWVPETGLIFPISPDHLVDDRPESRSGAVALDVGESGVTVAHLWQRLLDGSTLIADEYVWNGRKKGLRDPKEQLEEIGRRWDVRELLLPPEAVNWRTQARRLGFRCRTADNDFAKGVSTVNFALQQGRLRLYAPGLPYTLRELSAYTWDEYVDRPEPDQFDDAADALRYGAMRHVPMRRGQLVTQAA